MSNFRFLELDTKEHQDVSVLDVLAVITVWLNKNDDFNEESSNEFAHEGEDFAEEITFKKFITNMLISFYVDFEK